MRLSSQAFTLIELMVVISIIILISVSFYSPYGFHQKKVALRMGAKEISQSLAEARNMAINGIDSGSGNLHVALKFSQNTNRIEYYSSIQEFSLLNLSVAESFKIKNLPAGIQLESVDGYSGDTLVFFDKISGKEKFFPDSEIHPDDQVDFHISYKGATESILQTNIRYYPQTHISDY